MHSEFKTLNTVENTENYSLVYPKLAIGLETASVSIVIDGQDVHQITRAISNDKVIPGVDKYSLDYKKLSDVLEANFPNLKRKYYITSEIFQTTKQDILENRTGHSKIRGMLDWLRYNRYIVRTIPVDVDPESRFKVPEGIMDVEIVTALFEAAKVSDHVIFMGSHRKFHTPLQYLFNEGKTITVISTIETKNVSVNDTLRQIDNFVDLAEPVLAGMLKTSFKTNTSSLRRVELSEEV